MASGLLAILDDIAMLMDDTAVMAKAAAQRTAGIVGDDVAVNAEAVVGIDPKREIPIIIQIAKGSAVNKCFLIPGALVLSAAAPWALTPLLMAGGAFLAYEAVHKTFGKHGHEEEKHHQELVEAASTSAEALLKLEQDKIKGAVRTDLILSAEIVAITLGTVAAAPLATQALVLGLIGFGLTVGVYGFVGGLVKIDDLGLKMMGKEGGDLLSKGVRKTGKGLVSSMPYIMKGMSVLGTAAMFLVGGGIVMHGIPALHHAVEAAIHAAPHIPGLTLLAEGLVGLVTGVAASGVWKVAGKPITAAFEALGRHMAALKRALPAFSKKK